MEIKVTKLEAATSQLATAIRIFFEDYDPISVHTLLWASLNILHDHIPAGEAWKHNTILHYNTIYIKDEARSEWANKAREASNFFKHADRDLAAGKTDLEFNTNLTKIAFWEALNCLSIVSGTDIDWRIEFRVFSAWFIANHPQYLKEEARGSIPELLFAPERKDKEFFLGVMNTMKGYPELFQRFF